MNKSIVLGLLSIFAVVAVVGGVAFANFSSSATNTGNTFGSGTLVLNINGTNPTSSPKFAVIKAVPGYSETQVFTLSNTGTVGAATTTLTGITVPAAAGNLGDVLTLSLFMDNDNDGIFDTGETPIFSNHLTTLGSSSAWTGKPLGFGLAASGVVPGDSEKVFAVLTFDAGAGDEYQGKTVSFDFTFQANQ